MYGRDLPLGGVQGLDFTPSNRTRSLDVATQIYPSAVCVKADGRFTKPSCVLQAVWPYWEISARGSTAQTELATRRNNKRQREGGFGERKIVCTGSPVVPEQFISLGWNTIPTAACGTLPGTTPHYWSNTTFA